eukprot:TRINITY_DN316_c0_g1_i2.p1 TRINITY_DN316_c0_g1~~TRINITY_DN316_c0_g1_i2.p1  ORF type:complete len:176 (-),score=18.17 TRINITY_DN316_c0_g1_i2:341-868(-)
MKEILIWMISNGGIMRIYTLGYILGGKMMDVATDATAVHPVMRQSVFQIETFDETLIQKLRDELPDSGAGFNHAAKNEPDWENQFWGSNRARLETLKKKWDPDNRFNCWHCVGYIHNPNNGSSGHNPNNGSSGHNPNNGSSGHNPNSGSSGLNPNAFLLHLTFSVLLIYDFMKHL